VRSPGLGWAGDPEAKVLFVGASPDWMDDSRGQPFSGKTGQFLRTMIRAVGLNPDTDCAYTNVLQCTPWKDPLKRNETRPPKDSELAVCQFRVLREIYLLNPKVVVPLGKVATRFFLGVNQPLAKFKLADYRGRVDSFKLGDRSFLILPTLHPETVSRSESERPLFEQDLRVIPNLLSGSFATGLPETRIAKDIYEGIEVLQEAIDYCASNSGAFVTLDLETSALVPWQPGARILGVSIAWKTGSGVYIPLCVHGEGPDFKESLEDYRKRLEPFVYALQRLFSVCYISNQNWGFDKVWFYEMFGIEDELFHGDTLIRVHLIYGETRKGNSLDVLLRDFYGYPPYDVELEKYLRAIGQKSYSWAPLSMLGSYAAVDSEGAHRLEEQFDEEIKTNALSIPDQLCSAAVHSYAHVEMAGIAIDTEILNRLNEEYPKRIKKQYYDLLADEGVQIYLNRVFLARANKELLKKPKKNSKPKDVDHWFALSRQLESKEWTGASLKDKKFFSTMGFNPSSPKMLAELLFEVYGIKFQEDWRTKTGGKSVGAKVFKAIMESLDPSHKAYKIVKKLSNYRADCKIYSGYIEKLPKFVRPDGTLQVKYQLAGTRTGRLSTSNFGVHTIPKKGRADIKQSFVSRWRDPISALKLGPNALDMMYTRKWIKDYPQNGGGLILSSDFSQLELRVLSAMSGDEALLQAFRDGQDLHQFVASQVAFPAVGKLCHLSDHAKTKLVDQFSLVPEFKELLAIHTTFDSIVPVFEADNALYNRICYAAVTDADRNTAKTINFAVAYGASDKRIAAQAKDKTNEEAHAFIAAWKARFPLVGKHIAKVHAEAKRYGFVRSPVGRLRFFPGVRSEEFKEVNRALRQAQNFGVQSGASDLCVISVILLMEAIEKLGLKSLVCGSIHDSILIDVYPGELLQIASLIKTTMEEETIKQPGFEWMTCPVIVDREVGISWGGVISIKSIEGNRIKFSGKPSDTDAVLEMLQRSYRVVELSKKTEETPKGAKTTAVVELLALIA
jgi:DNA polymerase-1